MVDLSAPPFGRAIAVGILYPLVDGGLAPSGAVDADPDLLGNPADCDEISPFIEMLWRRGTLYEDEVIKSGGLTVLDLSHAEGDEKERLTLEAMKRGEPLIYSGRISAGDLLGIPDLLRRVGSGYLPTDIKSGRGKEGGGDDEGDGNGRPTTSRSRRSRNTSASPGGTTIRQARRRLSGSISGFGRAIRRSERESSTTTRMIAEQRAFSSTESGLCR